MIKSFTISTEKPLSDPGITLIQHSQLQFWLDLNADVEKTNDATELIKKFLACFTLKVTISAIKKNGESANTEQTVVKIPVKKGKLDKSVDIVFTADVQSLTISCQLIYDTTLLNNSKDAVYELFTKHWKDIASADENFITLSCNLLLPEVDKIIDDLQKEQTSEAVQSPEQAKAIENDKIKRIKKLSQQLKKTNYEIEKEDKTPIFTRQHFINAELTDVIDIINNIKCNIQMDTADTSDPLITERSYTLNLSRELVNYDQLLALAFNEYFDDKIDEITSKSKDIKAETI